MGKCFMLQVTNEFDLNDVTYEIESLPDIYRVNLTKYDSNPLEKVKEKLESITCLAAEGPEIENHAELFQAIAREALKAIEIMEGK